MAGDNKKTSLTHEEFMNAVSSITRCTTITDLLNSTRKSIGLKHSLYRHFPAIGAVDFKNAGVFHSYKIPSEFLNFIRKNDHKHGNPLTEAVFAKGNFLWLSESYNDPFVVESDYQKIIKHVINTLGDGLCYPLYGPDNRRGYTFIGFAKNKEEFDPIFPHQVQCLVQLSHVRYCLMVKALHGQIKLTKRESEVLELISHGKTNPEIALILGISPRTVAVHASKIFFKLGTTDRVSAAMRAQTINIVI